MRETWVVPRPPVARAVAAIVLAASLSACRVDANVEVNLDRAGAGTIVVTLNADAELVKAAPGVAGDVRLADLAAAGWTTQAPAPTADGGVMLVMQHSFATPDEARTLLGELSGVDGPFHDLTIDQHRSFATIDTKVTGSIKLVGGLAAFADADVVAKLGGQPYQDALVERGLTLDQVFGMRLVVTAPGSLVGSNGKASPEVGVGVDALTAVEWRADIAGAASLTGQSVTLETKLADEGARSAQRWRDFAPWAAAAWLAFVALVLVPGCLLIRRLRRSQR